MSPRKCHVAMVISGSGASLCRVVISLVRGKLGRGLTSYTVTSQHVMCDVIEEGRGELRVLYPLVCQFSSRGFGKCKVG